MSYYFRDKPRFSERLRGNSGDDLMESLKRQFDQDSKLFFEPTSSHRSSREREQQPFDQRHIAFPRGFPFDDDGFERRGNIRSHLDDLAARHPEFADHLLGPAWGDAPFLGTPRNRRRSSGLGGGYQGHPDDDARSQASGSSAASAASAASGASGVSSHCEADGSCGGQDPHVSSQDQEKRHEDGRTSNPIPQYGLRNTVDIGQHRHNMENNDKLNRGQRSASAPPENRQTEPQHQQHEQQTQNPSQRFVSRVDITPQQQGDATKSGMQSRQPQQQQSPPPPPPQSPQQQKGQQKAPQAQQHGNVRHIPIFVEGRDEPVIPRNVEEPAFAQPQQRPQSPPQFHRPSHYNQHFANNRQQQWPPQYHHPQQQFYQQPHHEQHAPPAPQTQKPNQYQQQQQQYRQQQAEKQRAQQQQQQQQQPQQQQDEAEPPKLKQIQPKEPLERVALVQQEVNSLTDQVKLFTGESRQAKDYMYLDEMLTRELIKLDDIETEGKPEVRQARKTAIKSIQECIALLESKVPLPGQEEPAQIVKEEKPSLPMETEVASVPETETPEASQASQSAPIPLPAAPSSEQNLPNEEERTDPNAEPKPAEAVSIEKTGSLSAMETQQDVEGPKTEAALLPLTESTECSNNNPEQQMDVDTTKATKSPKKGRKTKMPTPVSEQPIPLPAPEVSHT